MSLEYIDVSSTSIPTTKNLTHLYNLSLIICLIMAGVSITSLVIPSRIYPTDNLIESFLTNDLVNLLVGVPILLISIRLTHQGKLIGLLLWPGAVMYITYNYIAYIFGMPLGWSLPFYLILVIGSLYVAYCLVVSMDKDVMRQHLIGVIPENLAGGVLVGLGVLFFVRVVNLLVSTLVQGKALPATEMSLLIADSLLSIPWVICGVQLLRRKALGYVTAGGLLLQGSALFLGLILMLLLRPLFIDVPIKMLDILTILAMGSFCFIPFGLFVRGVIHKRAQQNTIKNLALH